MKLIDIKSRIQEKHGSKYTYTLNVDLSSNDRLDIICKDHGTFSQILKKHLIGQGCTKCASDRSKMTISDFIEKSNSIHSNKYDYSISHYVNNSTKIDIICKDHGVFKQIPNNHISKKYGCPKCNYGISYNNDDFVKKSNIKHSNKYDYSKSVYENSQTKVDIICNNHGIFKQLPAAHMMGQGCKKCYTESKKFTKSEFENRSKIVHGSKYSVVDYVSTKDKCTFLCDCGFIYKQCGRNHLMGQGCPVCSGRNISKMEIKWLDTLCIDEKYRHRSIEIDTKKYHVDAYDFDSNIIYEFFGDYWHGNPDKFKQDDINKSNKIKYSKLFENTMKRIELFKKFGYILIYIWEKDFKENDKNIRSRSTF